MKTILIAAVSADGFIAEAADQNSTDWTSEEDLRFFVQKTKECGVMVMGRKTYDTIGHALKDRLIVVMTRNPSSVKEMDGVEATDKPPKEILCGLAARGYGQVAVAGGGSVYARFLQDGLVDELFLTVEPVLFGAGVPLAKGCGRVGLELLGHEPLGAHGVLLHYKAKPAA